MTIYTRKDWSRDRSFNAAPGQEIEESIYEDMFDCMLPYRLPRCAETEPYSCGFLMGEPNDSDPATGRLRYLAFGKRNGKFYYIGKLPCITKEERL